MLTTRRSTTCTVLCVNPNSIGSDRGFGMQDLVRAEECSHWECGCSGTIVCDLPERVREFHSSPR
jgi:hypothetical protein